MLTFQTSQRLQRQAAISNNVDAVKSMTFETLAGLLETKAADMGVMLLNIETSRYQDLLGNLKSNSLAVDTCCDLDSRVLFLEGFDAGIIIEVLAVLACYTDILGSGDNDGSVRARYNGGIKRSQLY